MTWGIGEVGKWGCRRVGDGTIYSMYEGALGHAQVGAVHCIDQGTVEFIRPINIT